MKEQREILKMDFNKNYDLSGDIIKSSKTDGELVIEEKGSVYKFQREEVIEVIKNVSREIGLAYKLQDFQVETIIRLVNSKDVFLIAPTGSGKHIIFS